MKYLKEYTLLVFLYIFFMVTNGQNRPAKPRSLKKPGLDDRNPMIHVSEFKYKDYLNLQKKITQGIWANARLAIKVAEKYKLNLSGYKKWFYAASQSQKYRNGYWLQFYIYRDLKDFFERNNNDAALPKLDRAYYGSDWLSLLK